MERTNNRATHGDWNEAAAVALKVEANGTVEALGVPGSDPEITALAEQATAAHGRRDMASVLVATRMIVERARAMAKQNTPTRAAS